MEKFLKQINSTFDINHLTETVLPEKVLTFELPYLKNYRVNHYCLKINCDSDLTLSGVLEELRPLIESIWNLCNSQGLPIRDRYVYLTYDNQLVVEGETQRTAGWHIDGMQGQEVTTKMPADFQFIVVNKLAPKFTAQKFDLTNFDEGSVNIFTHLEKQIDENKVTSILCNKVYLMNPYMPHCAVKAANNIGDRAFFRLSFTHTPVTSVWMTINPEIKYNYPI